MRTSPETEARRWPFVGAMVLGLAVYISCLAIFGRFSVTDDVFFKAAGREWAATGRFAAPDVAGFMSLNPPVEKIWFAQPPLYTFLFGVFVRCFGFGWRQVALFDGLIHCALSLLTFVVTLCLGGRRRVEYGSVAALLVLPLGTPGRPDELAMCFGIVGLACLLRRPGAIGSAALCGAAIGLSCATGLVVGAAFAFTALGLVIFDRDRWDRPVPSLVLAGAALALAVSSCAVPILAMDPGAYRQFFTHAGAQFGTEMISGMRFAWKYGQRFLWIGLGALISCGYAWRKKDADWARFWIAPALYLIAIRAALPTKYLYIWFLGPWFIAVTFAVLSRNVRPARRPWGVLAALSVCYVAAAIPAFREAAIVVALPERQRLAFNVGIVREMIPKGSRILGTELWPSLGNDYRFYSEYFAAPDCRDIDYILLTGNGSGQPGKPIGLKPDHEACAQQNFVVAENNLNREPFRLAGIPLSRSAWGFGCVVLRRKDLPR